MKGWKDIVQYTTAVASLTSGIVLAFFQYFDSQDISNGVLGYVAQTLVYAASIFGVAMYWNGKYQESNNMWNNRYNELKQMVNDESNRKSVDSSEDGAEVA